MVTHSYFISFHTFLIHNSKLHLFLQLATYMIQEMLTQVRLQILQYILKQVREIFKLSLLQGRARESTLFEKEQARILFMLCIIRKLMSRIFLQNISQNRTEQRALFFAILVNISITKLEKVGVKARYTALLILYNFVQHVFEILFSMANF